MPQPLRRLALAAALCLAGGAFVTVLVAWGFALYTKRYHYLGGALVAGVKWPIQVPGNWPVGPMGVGRQSRVGVQQETSWAAEDGSFIVTAFSMGWPWPAMRLFIGHERTGLVIVKLPGVGLIDTGPGVQTLLHAASSELPRLPLFGGFAADTLLCAAILAGLFIAPPRVRRVVRRRRGRCLACGYSLSGLPPGGACPECGGKKAAHPAQQQSSK